MALEALLDTRGAVLAGDAVPTWLEPHCGRTLQTNRALVLGLYNLLGFCFS